MSRPLVVMQLISNLRIGGAQSVVVSLCNELLRAGHSVVLVTLGEGGASELRLAKSPALTVHHLNLRRRSLLLLPWFLVSVARIVLRLAWIMRRHRVDVVQSHMGDSNYLGLLAARLAGVPRRFATFHSLVFLARTSRNDLRNRLAKRVLRAFSGIATAFVAISAAVRDKVIAAAGLAPERVVVVRNGIELPPPVDAGVRAATRAAKRGELTVGADDVVLVCVGRLHKAKGHEHLLRALALLAGEMPRLAALLVGDGEERAALEALAAQLGVQARLRFLGQRNDVAEILAAADLFVLPSDWEGLPMALLEAMAAGLPCIATRVAGTVEVLTSPSGRRSGILVPPKDPPALAAAIRELLRDPAEAARIARQGEADVRSGYGMESVCARYLALYRREPDASARRAASSSS